jgi:hypothetical protein
LALHLALGCASNSTSDQHDVLSADTVDAPAQKASPPAAEPDPGPELAPSTEPPTAALPVEPAAAVELEAVAEPEVPPESGPSLPSESAGSSPEPEPGVVFMHPVPEAVPEPEPVAPMPTPGAAGAPPVVAPNCPEPGIISDPCDALALFAADGVAGDGCAGAACHVAGARVPDLVSPGVVDRLRDQRGRGAGCSSYIYFDPNDVENSLVLRKVTSDHGTCGGIMPPRPGRLGCRLDPVNVECIRQFLSEAAQ